MVVIELYIFAVIIIAYGIFITLALYGFSKLKRVQELAPPTSSPSFISIVVSARNEEANITLFLQQLSKQQFSSQQFEIIIIDDASEDNTFFKISEFATYTSLNIQAIREEKHLGKKKCLSKAIHLAKGDIIITTDADVIYRNAYWLQSISSYFASQSPNMLVMPIDFHEPKTLLELFQVVENLALTVVTAGFVGINKAFLCNGANLAFKKSAYLNANGYAEHLHLSSGEDVFLLEALKKQNPKQVHYVINRALIVKTKACANLKEFFYQRVRWAQKAKYNHNFFNAFAGFLIVIANMLILAFLVAILKKSIIMPYLSIFVLTKFVFDFLLLFLASDFLGRIYYLVWIIPFSCVYWIYSLIIGIGSLCIKPIWKDKLIH
jgi:poly-beta-1,6-N-acetyl-D-glucosamine synthase